MKRWLFLLLLIVTSCSDSNSKTGAESPGGTRNEVIVCLDGEPDLLNPVITTSSVSSYILVGALGSMIYESLLRDDLKTGMPTEPGLATGKPQVSEDHLNYTFHIRDGVKWHDGKPFSVEDILFTMKAAVLPSVDAAAFRSAFSYLSDVEITGPNEIRFRMSQPYWLNDAALGSNIAPLAKHIYDPKGVLDHYSFRDLRLLKLPNDPALKDFADSFNRNPANRAPVGTGPYKLDKWDTGQGLVLIRNQDYWGEKPRLEKIIYRVVTNPSTALAALKAGEVDFLPRLQPSQFQEQTDGPGFNSRFLRTTYRIPQITYIGWNESRPFFADKRVRQALTMLVDRAKVIDSLRRGMAVMAASPLSPESPNFDSEIVPLPYDPARAARLLDEAGWIDHNGNGIRDKNGVEFKFEILASTSNVLAGPLIDYLQSVFAKAGIAAAPRRVDPAAFQSTLRDQNEDAAIGTWTTGLNFDFYQLFHSESARNRGSNFFNFRNPEGDALMERARVEFDAEQRRREYWRFQEILHDEQPYTLLYYPSEAAAYNRRLQNVQFIPERPGYDITQWSVR